MRMQNPWSKHFHLWISSFRWILRVATPFFEDLDFFWGRFFSWNKHVKERTLRFENLKWSLHHSEIKVFDSWKWDFWHQKSLCSYCRFLFLGPPPPPKKKKKNAKKKRQKKRPKKNTTTPWPPHIPKQSRQKMPFPGNPGKMHDEVKREYAADEKMASSQPWELRFCGDFMPFWKPKKTGSAYPP